MHASANLHLGYIAYKLTLSLSWSVRVWDNSARGGCSCEGFIYHFPNILHNSRFQVSTPRYLKLELNSILCLLTSIFGIWNSILSVISMASLFRMASFSLDLRNHLLTRRRPSYITVSVSVDDVCILSRQSLPHNLSISILLETPCWAGRHTWDSKGRYLGWSLEVPLW